MYACVSSCIIGLILIIIKKRISRGSVHPIPVSNIAPSLPVEDYPDNSTNRRNQIINETQENIEMEEKQD